MRSRFGRRGIALLTAVFLTLGVASPTTAAPPQGYWVTWFASATLPAGTWAPGTYEFFVDLHVTFTLPEPGGDYHQFIPIYGPYEVTTTAPLYPGNVILRTGSMQAVTGGTKSDPVCSSVSAINPDQPSRVIIGLGWQDPSTRAEWNRWMATTTLTAAPNDRSGRVLTMRQLKTEPYTGTESPCQFAFKGG